MRLFIYPPQSVSVAVPPVEFLLNGTETTVSRDTGTPGNSRPLPVINLDGSGNVASPLTDTELRATPVPVSGPLTNAQLRATPVPVSSSALTDTELRATPVPVSGPITDGQLRASPVPVSGPLTDAQLRAVAVPVSVASLPNPTGAATEAKQDTGNASLSSIDGKFTTLNAKDFATSAKQDAEALLIGAVNESSPASDTASSGLNGRLQRIAQRITSLIALLPASLGQKAMANSFAVAIASDQGSLAVTQTALTASFQEITNLTTSAQTFTAPAGAKWAKVMNVGTENIRVKIGGAATIASGLRLEPGRSEDFMAAGNISVIAETGTNQEVAVQFGA